MVSVAVGLDACLFLNLIHEVYNPECETISVNTKDILLEKHSYFRTFILKHAMELGQPSITEAHL